MTGRAVDLRNGDCLDVLAELDADSVDAIVTDPPYGLSFMGKAWDKTVPSVDVWRECLRVLKPGGHLLAFAGTRTQHRMAVAIEDAGFEIRDMIAWVYGSGFPKSHDVAKGIDKAAGAVRDVVGVAGRSGAGRNCMSGDFTGGEYMTTAPATPDAARWQGWGTALKPALEPITVARKPLAGTVAANVLSHGTGAINVDGCRVGTDGGTRKGTFPKEGSVSAYGNGINGACEIVSTGAGRWPANLIHDGSDEPADLLGDAARFFYCAKTSKADRNDGARNPHPTVKPTALMRYLCRLVTPPGGVVLDPFMGSGSTGRGAVAEGFAFVGIEMDPEYLAIAEARIAAAQRAAANDNAPDADDAQPGLPLGEAGT